MGCWNGTCGISRLPLYEGDPVVLFPLLQEQYFHDMGGGFCHASDRAQPMTIGIRGEYNDYGGIKNLQGESLPLVKRYFSEDVSEFLDATSNPVELDYANLELVLNKGIERGKLYSQEMHYITKKPFLRPLGLMMVHAGLYDKLVAQIGDMHGWDDSKTLRQAYLQDLTEVISPTKHHGTPEYLEAMRELTLMKAGSGFSRLVAVRTRFTKYFLDEVANEPEPIRKAVLTDLVDLLLFDQALQYLRTPWAVQCGAGSQTGYCELHRTVALDITERIQAQSDEDAEELEV